MGRSDLSLEGFIHSWLILLGRFAMRQRAVMPHLLRIWRRSDFDVTALPETLRNDFIEASLSVLRFSSCPEVYDGLQKILQRCAQSIPSHLYLAIMEHRCGYLRRAGNLAEYIASTREALSRYDRVLPCIRLRCQVQLLRLALAESLIVADDFDGAYECLLPWSLQPGPNAEMETHVSRLVSEQWGRILRYQGKFPEARDTLEVCLGNETHGRVARNSQAIYHITHHLSDVLCELDLWVEA